VQIQDGHIIDASLILTTKGHLNSVIKNILKKVEPLIKVVRYLLKTLKVLTLSIGLKSIFLRNEEQKEVSGTYGCRCER
jgi:hypothetical protein